MARKSKAVAGLEDWAVILWDRARADSRKSFIGTYEAWRAVKFQFWGMSRAFSECGEDKASDLAQFLGDLAAARSVML